MNVKMFGIIVLFLIVSQQPSFTAELRLDKSFYQPGETVYMDIAVYNGTVSKECLQSLDITVTDAAKPLCTLTNSYPVDTECIEAGEEATYSFFCDIPLNAVEGVAAAEAIITTWSGIHIMEEVFFEIGINYPPEITVASFPDEVNPAQFYSLTFSVTDNFGVEDLVSADVVLHHEVISEKSERGRYQFSWEKPDLYTVWNADSPISVEASLQTNGITWTIHFSLSEVAAPGEWGLDIEVYDTRHQHHYVTEHFTVTKYLSFHIADGTRASGARINFGRASPGEELPRVTLTLAVTSNSPVNVFVEGSDLYSPEGAALPVGIFYVEASKGIVQLSSSRQGLYLEYAQRNGFSKEAVIRIVFWGKLPEVLEAGTYSGIWYIVVEAV